MAQPNEMNTLTRKISRKLEIQGGMTLTYNDLTLLVASGAFKALQAATAKEIEEQCQSHQLTGVSAR